MGALPGCGASVPTEAPVLAGLQKSSLIDFPGRVSCVAFFTGCNFACPYCHNPELARGAFPQRITLVELVASLEPRRHLLDGVVISGGEPTLHPGLPALCRAIRTTGLFIKLDTNGSRPAVLEQLARDHLIDFVAMDIKTDPARYAPPLADAAQGAAVAESIRLLMASGLDYEFRTTCVRPFVDAATITAIAGAIRGARQYTLQTFRADTVLQPVYFQGSTPGYTPSEMDHLRQLAAPHVQRCLVR